MKRVWQIGNIVSLAFALTLNGLVGANVLDLPSIAATSDKFATFLTPADYAFSIWSLIYLLLVGFVIYQARDLFSQKSENDAPNKIGPLFVFSSLANSFWLLAFVSGFIGLSVLLLIILTASLYAIIYKLDIALPKPTPKMLLFTWWPITIYTGWTTVAAVTNIASWLDSLGISISAIAASVVLMILATALLLVLKTRNVRELLLASAWGITAIGLGQSNELVKITAFSVAIVLLAGIVVHGYSHRHELIRR